MRDPSMNSDYSYPLVTTCMGRFLGWDVSYVLDNLSITNLKQILRCFFLNYASHPQYMRLGLVSFLAYVTSRVERW